jgi:hypothetical protein
MNYNSRSAHLHVEKKRRRKTKEGGEKEKVT